MNITRDDVIVLSFKPYAFNLISSGKKKIEYRTRFRRKKTLAFLYVSAPIKSICGYMYLDTPIIGTANEMRDIAESYIKGNGQSVFDYFKEKNKGYALPILEYKDIEPISLNELRLRFNFVAPQFYILANKKKDLLDFLIEKSELKI